MERKIRRKEEDGFNEKDGKGNKERKDYSSSSKSLLK